jgi:DNA-binding transcriptional MerR regulator
MSELINITQLAKILTQENSESIKITNQTLRYWEKEFTKINPVVINNRRYYSKKQISIVKLIMFLLKEKGMTINGVKKVLKYNINSLDDYNSNSLKAEYLTKTIKVKTKEILNKIKKIKKYGKKNTS